MFEQFDGSGRAPRQAQKDFLTWLEANWEGAEVFSLQAPTGSGKSFIAKSIQNQFKGAIIITCNNELAKQYSQTYRMNVFAGKAHYISLASYGQSYYDAVSDTPTVVNPISFLKLREHSKYKQPSVIIMDEADQFLSLYYEVVSKKIELAPNEKARTLPEALKLLRDRVTALNLKLEDLKPGSKKKEGIDVKIAQYKSLIQIVGGEEQSYAPVVEWNEEKLVYELRIIPIKFPLKWLTDMFKGSKIILMSATIFDTDVREMFGERPHLAYEMPSPIPVERRKIIFRMVDTEALRYPTNFDVIAAHLDAVLEEFKERPALIHTTYREAQELSKRMLTKVSIHDKINKKEVLENWKRDGGVLMGCGMSTGLDLKDDLCRLNIVLKGNFPSTADLWVEKRLASGYAGQHWYEVETLRHFIQASGRGVRHETDSCINVFCDDRLYSLVNRHWTHTLPGYIREAVLEGTLC